MILYHGTLPPGALVRHDICAPAPIPVHLAADPARLVFTAAGRVSAWAAQDGAAQDGAFTAEAVAANETGTGYDAAALRFAAGENGGLLLQGAIPAGDTLSFGMIFTPGATDARTLLTLQAMGADGYLFVSAEAGLLRLAQKGGTADLVLPLEGDGARLLLCALSGGQARLALNGGAAVSTACTVPHGPADLYIGCRGARAGLRGKLGAFALTDVLLWPGQDVLAAPGGADAATALWTTRLQEGQSLGL